jgi:hypothetical protein
VEEVLTSTRGGGASQLPTPGLKKKRIKIRNSEDICQILILNIKIIFKFGPIYASVWRPTTLGTSVKYFNYFFKLV